MAKMKAGRFWLFAGSLLGAFSIRAKIMGIVVGLALLLGGGVTIQMRASQELTLGEELAKRGESIARFASARATDYVLTNNSFALHQLVRDTVEDNEDVRYAFVLDPDGAVLAHSFTRGLPRDLAEANSVEPGARYRMVILETEEGRVRDVAVPILEGRAGTVRVGMSDIRLRSLIAVTTQQLLEATLLASLAGLALAFLLTVVLTRPIGELVRVAEAVTAGDLGRQARVWTRDEIGHLSHAFNTMTTHLARYSQQILRRNRELAALNAVATAIARPSSREELLSASLEKVLEVVELGVGAILLHDPTSQRLVFAATSGLSWRPSDIEPCSETEQCLCWDVFASGRSRVVSDISSACPRMKRSADAVDNLQAGVCVPIISKDAPLGVLHVAGPGAYPFSEEQLSILRSIGHQIGVAVENARLWEELRQREALRTHLLERIIAAQEDERRRIARELHDDMAQGLTVLLMNLEAAEIAIPPELGEVRRQLARTRDLLSGSLAEVRRLIVDLRPLALDSLGLAPAIRWYAEHRLDPLDVDVDVQGIGLDRRLAPLVETTVFRIVQEAINNVAKHSHANTMRIEIQQTDGFISILASDDGSGFDVERVIAKVGTELGGVGLLGMQERAALLGGSVHVESAPGQGTRVLARIPIQQGGDSA
ncbi:MAG: GAF domain-containing protein [Chloroflexi bacterium]|nr:GAF domain-containing protein [Chloroflexota bacterium]